MCGRFYILTTYFRFSEISKFLFHWLAALIVYFRHILLIRGRMAGWLTGWQPVVYSKTAAQIREIRECVLNKEPPLPHTFEEHKVESEIQIMPHA